MNVTIDLPAYSRCNEFLAYLTLKIEEKFTLFEVKIYGTEFCESLVFTL